MAYDRNNIFAKIVRGEAPCVKVYEDDATLAFMDIRPQSEGHTLVLPKADGETIYDLDPRAATALMLTTQKVARAVKAVTGCAGVTLAQLNGPAAGQTVGHVHFHVIPRYDGGTGIHGRNAASPAKLEAIAAKIRAAMTSLD